MFSIGILIGAYSYLIFALGLSKLLYKENIIFLSIIFLIAVLIYYKNYFVIKIKFFIKELRAVSSFKNYLENNKVESSLFFIIFTQALINSIGVLGPEISFDALWYHLTLPKIYLINHEIFYIPGSLLYYSVMPKLTEMLYIVPLSVWNEIGAKFIHFSFGILSALALYFFSRKFFPRKLSLLGVVVFYSSLVVGWESISAYVDLARTFFELMALWGFINWWESKDRNWLIESAVMLGLLMSVKILSISSFFIFIFLIICKSFKNNGIQIKEVIKNISIILVISLFILSPSLIFSFKNTGNPIYPFFTNIYPVDFNWNLINPRVFLNEIWINFTRSQDPFSPIYIIFLPLTIIFFKKIKKEIRPVFYFSILAILVWYLTPRSGGGRFILPYLPILAIIIVATIDAMKQMKRLQTIIVIFIILTSMFSVGYRAVANSKFIPVIFGLETKSHFLERKLDFKFGNFYDIDGYFQKNIKRTDSVLLYGFHNLYYVDFPFIDSSWVKKGNKFNYIAVQSGKLPERFKYWDLIYENKKTYVKLYSLGGQMWVY